MKKNKKWLMFKPGANPDDTIAPGVKYCIQDVDDKSYYVCGLKVPRRDEGVSFITGDIFTGSGYEKGGMV